MRGKEKTNRSQNDSYLRTDKHFTTKGFGFFFLIPTFAFFFSCAYIETKQTKKTQKKIRQRSMSERERERERDVVIENIFQYLEF